MTYSTDIDALNPDHRWDFDGDSLDNVGAVNGTDTSVLYTSSAICRDSINCVETDAVTDRVSIPSTTNINNSAQTRKAVGGWFLATSIQTPPKRIYGEGNNATTFQFVMAYGNNCMFEVVEPTNFTLQVFGPVIQPNRAYHFFAIFEGNGFGNIVRFYVDGVLQTNASPTNRQPNTADLDIRGVGEFGDPAGTVGIGGDVILLTAPLNGKWNQWATWDGANAVLTDTQVRQELFEKGAIPDVSITSDTNALMQTAINAYTGTTRPDAPLCISIPDTTDVTDFTINLNNITFDDLASIHIEYTGANILTLVNINGSNCSIISSTGTGSVVVKTEVTLEITNLALSDSSVIQNTRVYIVADTGGDLPVDTVIINDIADVNGVVSQTFQYTNDQPIKGWCRKQTNNPYYKEQSISGSILSTGLNITQLLISDD